MSQVLVDENPYSSLSPLVAKKKSSAFHPTKPFFKYVILLLLSTVCFGAYYSYNEIGPIEHSILEYLDIYYVQFGLLYAVYSVPNIVLPFVGGSLADRLGLHRLAVICRYSEHLSKLNFKHPRHYRHNASMSRHVLHWIISICPRRNRSSNLRNWLRITYCHSNNNGWNMVQHRPRIVICYGTFPFHESLCTSFSPDLLIPL